MRTLPVVALALLVAAAPIAGAAHAQRFHFAWRETPGGTFFEGHLGEGQVAAGNATLPANLTTVLVRLVWADDAGAPDTFGLAVDGPGGRQEGVGSDGEIALAYNLSAPPSGNWTVDAGSEQEARAASAAERPADGRYAGAWEFTIWLQDAGDAGWGVFAQEDTGNAWRLEVAWTTYEAALVGSEPAPHDGTSPVAELPVGGPTDRPPVVPREPAFGGMGLGLVVFAALGVGMWAAVARWRRQGRLE